MSVMAGQDNRNVQVQLTANVDPFQRAMADAGKATTLLLTGVTKLGRSIDDMVKKAGRRMVLVGTGEIASLVAAAEAANRLDTALTQVRATSAITGQNVGALRNQVLQLSRTIPDSTNNIARLVGQMQALGIRGTQNIANFTKMAEQLAVATNTAPGQLLTSIVDMNREMGTGLANVSNYSSALVELSKTLGVSANDIMGFAGSIQAVAQQAGYTQTQIMGLAAAFTRAGADSGAAANVFTNITTQINEAITTGNAQLQQFGQLIHMTAAQFRSFAQQHPEQAFERIIQAIGAQGQGGILTLNQLGLGNPRSVRAIAQMTSGQANIASAMNTASDAFARNDAMAKSSASAWNDLSAQMQKMRNMLDDIVIRMGGPMLHVLGLMAEGVNAVLGPINTVLAAMGPWPGIIAAIGGAFLAITGTITAFSFALLGVAAAWRALSGMTGTNTLQGLVNGFRSPQGQAPFANPRTIIRNRPINMDRRSGAAQNIYSASYGLGQRFSAPPPLDPTFAQRVMNRTGRVAGSLLTFPFRKLGAEGVEAWDTIKHPLNYENRSLDATSPYSGMGMFQRSNRYLQEHGGFGGLIRGAGVTMRAKLGMDTTEAEAKLAQVKAQAAQRIEMRVDAGRIPSSDLRAAVGGRQIAVADLRAVANNAPELLEADASGGFFRRAARAAGGGAVGATRGVMAGLGALGAAASAVAGPLALVAGIGIPLYEGFMHLHRSAKQAADAMDDLGAGLVQTAGGTYNKPGPGGVNPPADRITPWGSTEIGTATSSAFNKSAGGDIGRLRGRQGVNRTRIAQNLVQNVIASNGGAGLSVSQQQALREELIAAYGPDQARHVYQSLNLNGVSPMAAAASNAALLHGVRDDSNIFENRFQGTNSAKRIRDAITPLANQLNAGGDQGFHQAALGLAALQAGMPGLTNTPWSRLTPQQQVNTYSSNDVLRLREGVGDVVSQLNKGLTGDAKIKINTDQIANVGDFIHQLQHGNDRAKTFAEQLLKAGLNLDNLSGSIMKLEAFLTPAQQRAAQQSRIGTMSQAFGFDPNNPANANYTAQMYSLTYGQLRMNNSTGANAVAGMTDINALEKARDAWEQYKSTLNSTSPALQGVNAQIDNLNQQINTQTSLFQNPQQVGAGLAQHANQLINQFGTNGVMGDQEQTYIGMAQQQIGAAESQLKSYMTQVHEYHLQEHEAFYERNQQIKQMNHEFNEQLRQMAFTMASTYGNPAQMVQSQFTMGAGSAVIGMQRQLDMLRQSRSTLDQLHSMGLSRDAIRLLGLDDPKNVEQAQRYLGDFARNPRLVQEFNKQIKGRLQVARGLDTDQNNSKFADMKRQFDYTAHQAELAFKHSQQQVAIQINELGKQLFTSMADLNHQAMASGLTNIQQYASGIMSAIGQVQTATTNFLNNSTLGGGTGGGPTVGGRKWTGTPHGKFTAPSGLHRAGKSAGVNAGFLLSSVSKPGTGMDRMGNPDLHWGKDVMVAPDNRTLSSNARLAQQMARAFGWGDGPEWAALYQIWQQESGFNTRAGSPRAAYGIPQSDPGIKMAAAGSDWLTNPRTQIKWGLANIARNYGDPLGAWAHKSRTGWYAKGGVFGSAQVIGVGENGPEAVLPLNSIGASFVSQVIARTMHVTRSDASMTHTAPRASIVYNNHSAHYDNRTEFNGPITVQSQDPNEMQRKLEQRKRMQALRRPVAGR